MKTTSRLAAPALAAAFLIAGTAYAQTIPGSTKGPATTETGIIPAPGGGMVPAHPDQRNPTASGQGASSSSMSDDPDSIDSGGATSGKSDSKMMNEDDNSSSPGNASGSDARTDAMTPPGHGND